MIPRPFEVSATIYAWDLHDEGVECLLDRCVDWAGINCVYLQALMHRERRPWHAGIPPFDVPFSHNPVRSEWIAEDARCYWHPNPARYGRIKPELSDHNFLAARDWIDELANAANRRGIRVGAELGHVLVSKVRADGPLADVAQRNIRGEVAHGGWGVLCLNHHDTLDFVANALAEWIDIYGLDLVQVATIPFWSGGQSDPVSHGGCFCPACHRAASQRGFDLEAAKAALLADPHAEPWRRQWLDFRVESTAEFWAALRSRLSPREAELRFLNLTTVGYQWSGLSWGIDPARLRPHIDSMRLSTYAEQTGDPALMTEKRAFLEAVRKEVPDINLFAGVGIRQRATPDLIAEGVAMAAACGYQGVSFAHYDSATPNQLRAVKTALQTISPEMIA